MFGIPGKAAVTLTPGAARQIARLMARDARQGLRIGVKKGGCAGMEYTMDYVSEVNPLDEVPGVGATRKRALLAHFGSAKAVSRANLADLKAVDGISDTLAETIYDFFHGAG